MKTLKINVGGRVQGVGFRVGVKDFCDKRKLHGWVKNRDNGEVEIIVQGEEARLKEFTNWLENSPGFSKVEKISSKKISAEKFIDFKIKTEKNFLLDQKKSSGKSAQETLKKQAIFS